MDKTEQQIAIAKILGFRKIPDTIGCISFKKEKYTYVIVPENTYVTGVRIIPKYYKDLNAISEAEKKTISDYGGWGIITKSILERDSELTGIESPEKLGALFLTLTAAQRCEIFLRYHNKWKND